MTVTDLHVFICTSDFPELNLGLHDQLYSITEDASEQADDTDDTFDHNYTASTQRPHSGPSTVVRRRSRQTPTPKSPLQLDLLPSLVSTAITASSNQQPRTPPTLRKLSLGSSSLAPQSRRTAIAAGRSTTIDKAAVSFETLHLSPATNNQNLGSASESNTSATYLDIDPNESIDFNHGGLDFMNLISPAVASVLPWKPIAHEHLTVSVIPTPTGVVRGGGIQSLAAAARATIQRSPNIKPTLSDLSVNLNLHTRTPSTASSLMSSSLLPLSLAGVPLIAVSPAKDPRAPGGSLLSRLAVGGGAPLGLMISPPSFIPSPPITCIFRECCCMLMNVFLWEYIQICYESDMSSFVLHCFVVLLLFSAAPSSISTRPAPVAFQDPSSLTTSVTAPTAIITTPSSGLHVPTVSASSRRPHSAPLDSLLLLSATPSAPPSGIQTPSHLNVVVGARSLETPTSAATGIIGVLILKPNNETCPWSEYHLQRFWLIYI